MFKIITACKYINENCKIVIERNRQIHINIIDEQFDEECMTVQKQNTVLCISWYTLAQHSLGAFLDRYWHHWSQLTICTPGVISEINIFPNRFQNVKMLELTFAALQHHAGYFEYVWENNYGFLAALPMLQYISIPLYLVHNWENIVLNCKNIRGICFDYIDTDIVYVLPSEHSDFAVSQSLISLNLYFKMPIYTDHIKFTNQMLKACPQLRYLQIQVSVDKNIENQQYDEVWHFDAAVSNENIISLPSTLIGMKIGSQVLNHMQFNFSKCINLIFLGFQTHVFCKASSYPMDYFRGLYMETIKLLQDFFVMHINSTYTGKLFLCASVFEEISATIWDKKLCALQFAKMLQENKILETLDYNRLTLMFGTKISVNLMQFFAQQVFNMDSKTTFIYSQDNNTVNQFRIALKYLSSNNFMYVAEDRNGIQHTLEHFDMLNKWAVDF